MNHHFVEFRIQECWQQFRENDHIPSSFLLLSFCACMSPLSFSPLCVHVCASLSSSVLHITLVDVFEVEMIEIDDVQREK